MYVFNSSSQGEGLGMETGSAFSLPEDLWAHSANPPLTLPGALQARRGPSLD